MVTSCNLRFIMILEVISAFAFLGYGFACLLTRHMEDEFERYGLKRLRHLTGMLEVSGGFGLLLGIFLKLPALLFASALGLSLLMICGVFVRLRIKDSFSQCLPALILLVVNAIIAFKIFQVL